MHIKSPSKLVRCTQIAQRKQRNTGEEDVVQVLQKMPLENTPLLSDASLKGGQAQWKEQREIPAISLKVHKSELLTLQEVQTMSQKPPESPAEISQGKLLEVALHSQNKLARGNFSRPQERETMQELPQRAKKQLGALRWLRTGSNSSKINNLLNKAMVRSNFFPQLFIICLFCITNQKFWLFCLFGKSLNCRRLKAYLFTKHQKGFLK